MTGKSHLTIGLITYASLWFRPLGSVGAPLFAGSPEPVGLPVALAAVALGALLPDLDHPRGALAREEIAGVPILRPVAWGLGAVFGHRGPTHSLLALAVILALGGWPGLPWAPLGLGWLLSM